MDIIRDIAIHLKDRIIVLDRDLLDRKVDVSKNSELYKTFHRIKGRHYKQLKQGPGWSFPITALEAVLGVASTPSQAPPTPSQAPPTPSQAPPTPSQAPPAPSQAPPTPSQAPPTPSKAPPAPSQAPRVQQTPKVKTKEHAYEADIPNEVRLYFKKYEALIFS